MEDNTCGPTVVLGANNCGGPKTSVGLDDNHRDPVNKLPESSLAPQTSKNNNKRKRPSSGKSKSLGVSKKRDCCWSSLRRWKSSSRMVNIKNSARKQRIEDKPLKSTCSTCAAKTVPKGKSSGQSKGRSSSSNSFNSKDFAIIKEYGSRIGLKWKEKSSPPPLSFKIGGDEDKFGWVKSLIRKENPVFFAIQETKLHSVDFRWVCSLLGSSDCEFLQKSIVGKSGGQLLIWDSTKFEDISPIVFDCVIGIRGVWRNSGDRINVLNIYGPHDDSKKQILWDSLSRLLGNSDDEAWILCGDFNEVRCSSERFNCEFNSARAQRFNDFIQKNGLLEIPLGGRNFTRVSDDGLKFSKLDRFLICEKFDCLWPNLSATALDRKHSDHCPLMINNIEKNYGPKPFKIFDAWLDEPECDHIVKEAWKNQFQTLIEKILELQAEVGLLDENGHKLCPTDIKAATFNHFSRIFSGPDVDRPSLEDLHYPSISYDDVAALELPFDEKEIHGAILDCGSTKAPGPDGFNMRFFKKYWDVIKCDLVSAIEWFWNKCEFSKGCNASFVTLVQKKKTDPLGLGDFRPISLIGSYYKIIAKILSNRLCKIIPSLIGPEQSAFLKERFLLDGALIVNESIDFLKAKKKKGILFKVDFEKAFDCLNWNFLLEVMKSMGFGEKWRKWIHACLSSASISILVNGSPTKEFSLSRGV
ncbi:uncharacterized protein [Rutidosis leptorrhynchoides]|uniref:uncharacterized protein n=1 Tax=Rutidosis leptorrhynchoides TaxID=125765 RepID=UPI003A99D849